MYSYKDFTGAHLKVTVVEPNGGSKDASRILENMCFNMVIRQELMKFQNLDVVYIKDLEVEKDTKAVPCAGLVLMPCIGSTSECTRATVKALKESCADASIVVWDTDISRDEKKVLKKLGAQHVFSDRNKAADLKNLIKIIKSARPERSGGILLSAN